MESSLPASDSLTIGSTSLQRSSALSSSSSISVPHIGSQDFSILPKMVIVLAGGSGKRLGGVSKADLRLGKYSFLEWTLKAIDYLPPTVPVIIVAPHSVLLPHSRRTLYQLMENPPGSGPACGFFAGLQKAHALWQQELSPANRKDYQAPWVALLPVDAPGAGACLPQLSACLSRQRQAPASLPSLLAPEGARLSLPLKHTDNTSAPVTAMLAEAGGYRQNVIGLFYIPAVLAAGKLLQLGTPHPRANSMKALISQLNWRVCPVNSDLVHDVDTPQDLNRLLQCESDWIELFQNMWN